jgi:heavy-metal exporter, HME family
MFNFLVTQSLRNRVLVLLASLVLIAVGVFTAARLPVDVLPDLNRPTVTIMAESHGLAPPEVEGLVTLPIETAMSGIPGVERVRSVSGIGLSIVYVEFAWDEEIYRARQQVAERLATVQAILPADVAPQMGPVTSIMGEIMMVAVTPGQGSLMQAREVADFVLRPRLLTIPGVAQVIPIGGEVRQYRVSPNLAAMQAAGLRLEDIEHAIEGFGVNTGGGFLDQFDQEFLIRNVARTTRIEDLQGLSVGVRNGAVVTLAQVASVDFAPRFPRGDAGFQGEPAVIIGIQKQPGADTIAVTRAVEEALAELEPTLPSGMSVNNVQFRQADFIEASIGTLQKVMIEAALVVAVVLFLFLLNVSTTAISLVSLPLSVLITALVFHLFGLSINTMTLGGIAIAIGELVDDAVVGVENVFRRLRENALRPDPQRPIHVIAKATDEVRSGIVYATMIIILVFLPLFFLGGVEGRLFQPLGVAYVVAILASLVTSITITPVLCYYLLPKLAAAKGEHDSWLVARLKSANQALLHGAFRAPGPVLAAALALTVAAGAGAILLPRAFLPAFNEGSFVVTMAFQPGISLEESARLGAEGERRLLEVDGVVSVGRRTGRAELDEHAEGVHHNEYEIRVDLNRRSRDDLATDIRAALGVFPGSVAVGQPIGHRLDHMLSGVNAQIAVKVFGENLDAIRSAAETLRARMEAIPGLVDVRVERSVRVPHLDVSIDFARASSYGVTPAQIAERLETLSDGRIVSQIIDGQRRFDVILRIPDDQRTTLALADQLIETPMGPVPLRTLADVRETDGPNQILREGGKRRIVISANAAPGADMGSAVGAIEAAAADLSLPTGGFVRVEGQYEAQQQATLTIGGLTLVSFALIFALLYTRYKSVALALIVMAGIPMALIGSVAALWIFGLPLSVASLIGFVTLTGIAARNGILKISHYLNLVILEGERWIDAESRDRLIIRGSLERMTPVLMTALSAGLALIPLILGAEEPGKEILHPVAVTIFGGLLSATLLDAVVTPILFRMFGRKPLERLMEERAEGRAMEAF